MSENKADNTEQIQKTYSYNDEMQIIVDIKRDMDEWTDKMLYLASHKRGMRSDLYVSKMIEYATKLCSISKLYEKLLIEMIY